MDNRGLSSNKDRRGLILVVLGIAILIATWFSLGVNQDAASFFLDFSKDQQYPTVVRKAQNIPGESYRNPVLLSAQTSCADTPPYLAVFFDLPMPVNQAGSRELTLLPGIGPRLAERIIRSREMHGTITGPDSLMRIEGIGTKMTDRLLPLLCFD